MVIQNEYDRALLENQQKIANQASTLRDQDSMLSDLQTKLDDQNLTIDELKAALNEQALLLDQKTIALSDKENELNSKTLELKGSKDQIDKIIGVKAEVIEALKQEFESSGTSVDIDTETGAMVLNSNIMFGFNEDVLTDDGKAVLDSVLPTYCGVLLNEKYLPYVAEILIDGYTDNKGTYEYNLSLSQKRSLAVANRLLEIASGFLDEEGVATLQSKLTVNGHSMNNLILDENGEVDAEKSRRVEIKFRLKDEEMLSSLSEILEDTGDGVEESDTVENSNSEDSTTEDNSVTEDNAKTGETDTKEN